MRAPHTRAVTPQNPRDREDLRLRRNEKLAAAPEVSDAELDGSEGPPGAGAPRSYFFLRSCFHTALPCCMACSVISSASLAASSPTSRLPGAARSTSKA